MLGTSADLSTQPLLMLSSGPSWKAPGEGTLCRSSAALGYVNGSGRDGAVLPGGFQLRSPVTICCHTTTTTTTSKISTSTTSTISTVEFGDVSLQKNSQLKANSHDASQELLGEFHDQGDRQELFVSLFTVEGWPLIGHCVTKNTNYALRAARPWAADRPAGGWPPAGRIVMTP
jgi:hypothetical protein